jgi:hypothetical protein
MSRAGSVVLTKSAKATQSKMDAERKTKIAAARKVIDAGDKVLFANFNKDAATSKQLVKDSTAARRRADEERERMEQAARERKQQETSDAPKAKRVKGERKAKSSAHSDYVFGRKIEDDDEFTAEMAKVLKKDASLTWAGVLVEMRKAGIAGGTKRAARLFSAAQ